MKTFCATWVVQMRGPQLDDSVVSITFGGFKRPSFQMYMRLHHGHFHKSIFRLHL
jgi:hypothetical protein